MQICIGEALREPKALPAKYIDECIFALVRHSRNESVSDKGTEKCDKQTKLLRVL